MNIQIGDRIKFRAACRDGAPLAWRKVVGLLEDGDPLVRFNGWRNFIVHLDEIIDHEPAAA